MIKKVIINKNNTLALDYLVDNFAGCGIKFKLKPSELFNSLTVEVDSELFESFLTILAKAIILSHKYPAIIAACDKIEYTYANVACISALLYFDLQGEVDDVISVIKGEDSISVEGTFDFKLSNMREDWEELESIAQILTLGESDEDIYNVTNFMLSNRNTNKSLFLAQYPDILLANVTDGLMVEHIKLHENEDFNLINTIIAEGASELIIEKNQLKQTLLDCLSNLVKIKIL